ncbi:hypothetical protein [Virgibacillus senegalensis]|uniref:hypothetical protein n=1 Tax=Virgibacillus senegalensis TaxID=1499679 RepID=UPI00069F2D1F|nr:hypothetical protein [Virgibacillus senegalensis]
MLENITTRKEGFIITDSGIGLNYTSEMEKAMHQNHGIGYAEYERKLEKRLEVEKEREDSYRKSRRVVAEVERQVHR